MPCARRSDALYVHMGFYFVEGSPLRGWNGSGEAERCVGGPLGAAVPGGVIWAFFFYVGFRA